MPDLRLIIEFSQDGYGNVLEEGRVYVKRKQEMEDYAQGLSKKERSKPFHDEASRNQAIDEIRAHITEWNEPLRESLARRKEKLTQQSK